MLQSLGVALALLLPHFPYAATVLDPSVECVWNARVVAELDPTTAGRWRIVPNCQWDELPKHAKLLSVAHELAHIERRHAVSNDRTEREADELAVQAVSKATGWSMEETRGYMRELRSGQLHSR